jgi:hypothetical protein
MDFQLFAGVALNWVSVIFLIRWGLSLTRSSRRYEFDPSDPWRQYTLTAWGHRFQKFANRPPPDQQMLNEVWVQRKDLDLHSTAVVLPTTVLNSRWPAWALDAPGGSKGMQFALHAYATSSEERVTLFRKLRRSLCDLGVDGFAASAVSPTAIAAPLLEGMWEHVKQDNVGAYKNALLCQSLYGTPDSHSGWYAAGS